MIRKIAEKCYYITLLTVCNENSQIETTIHRKLTEIVVRKCDVRRMSTRRRCDVTLLSLKLLVFFNGK